MNSERMQVQDSKSHIWLDDQLSLKGACLIDAGRGEGKGGMGQSGWKGGVVGW